MVVVLVVVITVMVVGWQRRWGSVVVAGVAPLPGRGLEEVVVLVMVGGVAVMMMSVGAGERGEWGKAWRA